LTSTTAPVRVTGQAPSGAEGRVTVAVADESMPVGRFEESDRKLKRVLSRSQLLMLSLGAIIGSGWLFAALDADATTGPSSVISWVIGGILVIFIALTYAEVATMIPRSGGVVRYPQLTHGGYTGFILGWTYLLASASVPAIEAIATVQYLAPHVPASWDLLQKPVTTSSLLHFPEGWLFTVVLLVIFFFINLYGARFLGRFNNTVMVWKIALPVLTFLFLFILDFHPSNFSAGGSFIPFGAKEMFIVIPGAGIVFSFLGFRQGLDFGGEARNPQRDIPLATIGAVVIGIVIYALLQLSFTGGIVWHALGIPVGSWAKLGNVQAATTSPFYAILKRSGVPFLGGFAALLLVDAVISPAGTGYIYLGTGGRTIYGMGVGGYLPKASTAVSERHRIPWVALVASLVVAVAFSIPSKSWYGLVGFITSATVFTYIMGGSGLAVLRRTAPTLRRPYRLSTAAFWAPLGFLAAVAIVFWSGFETLAPLVAAVFVALPLYSWFGAPHRGHLDRWVGYAIGAVYLAAWILLQHWGHWVLSPASPTNPHQHAPFLLWFTLCAVAVYGFSFLCWLFGTPEGKRLVNTTWWLITLIFGEFVLSYYSSFGVTKTQPHFLQFPYDTIWALLFGLVMFYWSVASGYQTEEIRDIIAAETGVSPEEAAATSKV